MIAASEETKGSWTVGSSRPRLSIVLISRGSESDLERALLAVTDPGYALGAQVVVVREHPDGQVPAQVEQLVKTYAASLTVVAPGSSRSAISDAAMHLVSGDIVAIREDVKLRDGDWLSAFHRSMGVTEAWGLPAETEVEKAVADERRTERLGGMGWRAREVALEGLA